MTRNLLFITLLVLTILIGEIKAQWMQTNGPFGGDVLSYTSYIDSTGNLNLFMGSGGDGVYLSKDKGLHWQQMDNGLGNLNISALEITPNKIGYNLYAGTDSGMFISHDNGKSWKLAGDKRWRIDAFAVSHDNSGKMLVYAGTDVGVFRSNDTGSTWYSINDGLNDINIWSLAVKPNNSYLFAGTADSGVYISSNGGEKWYHSEDSKISNRAIMSLVISNSKVFAGTDISGILVSDDNGISWSKTAMQGGRAQTLCATFDSTAQNEIFAGMIGSGVFRSTNDGAAWEKVSNNIPTTWIWSLFTFRDIQSNENVITGTVLGNYLSTNDGSSWTQMNNGLVHTSINNIVSVANRADSTTHILASTEQYGLFVSTDNGQNWTPANNGLPNDLEETLCLATTQSEYGGTDIFVFKSLDGIYLSTDFGKNWLSTSFPKGIWVNQLATSPNGTGKSDIFAGTYNGVFLSSDDGKNWVQRNNGLQDTSINGIGVVPSANGGEVILASTFNAGVFRSTDDGSNWTQVEGNISNSQWIYVTCFASLSNGNGKTTTFAGTNYGTFYSTDFGINWTETSEPSIHSTSAFAVSGGDIFAGSSADQFGDYYGRIFVSTDEGYNWATINNGLKYTEIRSLVASGGYLFAATRWRGVWRRPLSEMITSVKATPKLLPVKYNLWQNYPNPFNPGTTIQYSINKESFVTIKVYDVVGRKVATLVNERKSAGNYSVNFNASNLSSGIYFYQMKAGNFIRTKKMIVLK